MREIPLILLTIILLSGNPEKSNQNETSDKASNELESYKKEINNDTSFVDFFESFMWDQELQKNRVLFPFDLNGNTIITASEWKHLPFYSDREYIPTLNSDTLSIFENNLKFERTDLFILEFKKESADKFEFERIDKKWYLKSYQTVPFNKLKDKSFIDFLIKFSSDSLFQKNHISFPLAESFADSDNNYETVSRTISLESWKFWELTYYINGLMFLSSIETDSKYRNIFYRGVENGIWVKYTFEKMGDSWRLIKLEDYST